MRTGLTLILLTCVVFANEDPLQPLQPLIGGSWLVDGELPGGQKIRTRLVAERQESGGHVRIRAYILLSSGEKLIYETYVFWHPGEKKLQYVTFAADGDVVWGQAKSEPNRLVLEQEAQGKYPRMRVEFEFDPKKKDTYTGRTLLKMGDQWKGQDARAHRVKGGPKHTANLPGKSTQLAPIERLFGGRWEGTGTWNNGSKLNGYNTYAWSLHGRVIESRTYKRDKEGRARQVYTGLHFWDPAKKRIGIVFLASGKLSLGAVTVDGDRWHYEWTTHTAKGASRLRETLRFKDKDTQVWTVEAERDGKWLPISGEMTHKRVHDE